MTEQAEVFTTRLPLYTLFPLGKTPGGFSVTFVIQFDGVAEVLIGSPDERRGDKIIVPINEVGPLIALLREVNYRSETIWVKGDE